MRGLSSHVTLIEPDHHHPSGSESMGIREQFEAKAQQLRERAQRAAEGARAEAPERVGEVEGAPRRRFDGMRDEVDDRA
jgi:hypothetical protein